MRKHFAFIPLIEGAGVFYFHAGFWAWTNSSTHKSKIPQPGLGKTKGKAEAHIFLSGCLFFSHAFEDFPLSLADIFCSSDDRNCLSASLLLGQHGVVQSPRHVPH